MKKLLFLIFFLPLLCQGQRKWSDLISTGDTALVSDFYDTYYFMSLDTSEASQADQNKLVSVYAIQNGFHFFDSLHIDDLDIDTSTIDSAYIYKGIIDSAVVNRFVLSSDPGADRILFWDESSDSTDYLTASTGLTISGTNLTVSSDVVTLTGSQTLTNKTLTSPVISTITNSGGDITLTPNSSNHVNISAGGLEIAGTEVISSSRDLTNIASITFDDHTTLISGSFALTTGTSNITIAPTGDRLIMGTLNITVNGSGHYRARSYDLFGKPTGNYSIVQIQDGGGGTSDNFTLTDNNDGSLLYTGSVTTARTIEWMFIGTISSSDN